MGFTINLVQPVYFMINKLRPEKPVDLPKIIPHDRRAENGNWVSRLSIQCFCHDIVYNFEKVVCSKYMTSLSPPSYIWFIRKKSL